MLQTIQVTATDTDTTSNNASSTNNMLDPRVLSSVMIAAKLNNEDPAQGRDPHERLLELLNSEPIMLLLEAARGFSEREGIQMQESLRQIVLSILDIDKLWGQVLLKEGLSKLSSQYH